MRKSVEQCEIGLPGFAAWHNQSLISRTLRGQAARSRIAGILSQESFDSRRALGRRVCEEFSFFDVRGRPQLAGCMKALANLAATAPEIVSPPPRSAPVDRTPRRLEGDVPEPVAVPGRLSGIGPVEVTAVADGAARAIWNTLIAQEHPCGLATFAGCQMRYLVGSAHGWLGRWGFLRRRCGWRRAVCVIEDQHGFILHRKILWTGSDVDVAAPMVAETQERFPDLKLCSFDRGFHSPANRVRLDELPRKGRLSKADREREGADEFIAARRQHPAVESAINNLEQRGLDRVLSCGADGFERTVALSIVAFNVHRIGVLSRRSLIHLKNSSDRR